MKIMKIMKMFLNYRQFIPLIVVLIGSFLIFVNTVFLLVNYSTHLAIIEYLEPMNDNQTIVLTNWQQVSEKGREMIKQVENAENSVGLLTGYRRDDSSMENAADTTFSKPVKKNAEIMNPFRLITSYRRDGSSSTKNAITFSKKTKNVENSVRPITDYNRRNADNSVLRPITRINAAASMENADNPVRLITADYRRNASSKLRSCDFSRGKWIYDTTGPLYRNNTCPIITPSQNCQRNGKPEKAYENWRWKPNECELPRLDGRKFLELMRGKTVAFVGDSLSRNQFESLVCILWQAEAPKRSRDPYIHKWYFKSTDTTIARIWSAWLVHSTPPPNPSKPRAGVNIHLDTPDETYMDVLPVIDVLILSSGHWFTPEPTYVLNGTIIQRPEQLRPTNSAVIRRQLRRRTKRSPKKQQKSVKSYDTAQPTQKKIHDMIKSPYGTIIAANNRTDTINSSYGHDIAATNKTNRIIKSHVIAAANNKTGIINSSYGIRNDSNKTNVIKSSGVAANNNITHIIKSSGVVASKNTGGVIKSSGKAANEKKTDIIKKSSGTAANRKPDIIKPPSAVAHELENDITFLSFDMAMQTALNAIINHPNYTGITIFRSYSPRHYVQGAWNTGGTCALFNRPSSKPTMSVHENAMLMKQVEKVEGARKRVRNRSKLRFMDISELSAYRHEGHPGPYIARQKGPEDCVHWCMPGPVDAWNEILFEIVQREI